MKKYLKEKGKQALEWAKIREDSNMNTRLQKLAEDSLKNMFDINKMDRNYHKQKKVMCHYEEAMWTIQKNESVFEENSVNKAILYPLNDIFMEALVEFKLSSLESGEIIASIIKQNYEMVRTNNFIVSNFEVEKKYNKLLNMTHDMDRIFLKMVLCKLKGLSYTDVLEVNEQEIAIFEEYYKK